MFNFDEIIDRRKTDSIKWKVKENELPMWVADMDFKTAPCIIDDIKKRADEGIFGYSDIEDEWFNAYINWNKNRHNFEIEKDWLLFSTGIIPSLSSIVRKLTTVGENVLVQTPVYNIFFNSIINNGRRILENPLIYRDGSYEMDFEDLEEKLKDPQTNMMILCNPHNPAGRIWTKEELAKVGKLAHEYNVIVVSDEVHCDIVRPGLTYIPFMSASDLCREVGIALMAPTKSFNIAGLCTSAICVANPLMRHKVWRGINTDEVAEPSSFACICAISAYTKGESWLDEMCEYVFENRKLAIEFIDKEVTGAKVVNGDATYLIWIDISAIGKFLKNEDDLSKKVATEIRNKTGLFITEGSKYGENGKEFLRMNLAAPREICLDGLNRLKEAIDLIIKENS